MEFLCSAVGTKGQLARGGALPFWQENISFKRTWITATYLAVPPPSLVFSNLFYGSAKASGPAMCWLFNWGNKSVAKPKNSKIVLLFFLNTLYLIIYASLDLGLNKLIRLILVQAGSLKDSKMQWINPAMKSSQNPVLLNPSVKNQVSIRKGDQKQSKVCSMYLV